MSFITDIIKFGLGRFGIEFNPNQGQIIGQSSANKLLQDTVNTTVKRTNTSTAENNTTEIEVKLDMKADTDANIPVIYGDAWVAPLLTDAQLTNMNCTMWYCLTLCETTGDLIDGTPSQITFEEIYWNDQKLTFGYDGNTVAAAWSGSVGSAAVQNLDPSGVIKIYCYNGGSESPCAVRPQGLTVQHGNAYDLFPGWDSTYQMSNLVFALVRVDYTPSQNIDGIGKLVFKLRNSMNQPGDVMVDYLTNDIYGAGIPLAEVDA